MTEMIRNRGTNFAKMRTRLATATAEENASDRESHKIDLSHCQTFVPDQTDNPIPNGNDKVPFGMYLKQKMSKNKKPLRNGSAHHKENGSGRNTEGVYEVSNHV